MPHRDLPLHQRFLRLLKAAGEEFGADMAMRFGAALSFYTLFSLVPLLFLVVAVVGFVSPGPIIEDLPETEAGCERVTVADLGPSADSALRRVLDQVEEVAGTQVADQLAGLTCQAVVNRASALGIGLALALFTGSTVFLHVQGILNHIFGAPEERTRGLVNMLVQRAIAVGWAVLLAVLVFVPIAAVATVNLIRGALPPELERFSPLLSVAVPLASLLLLMVVTALTFQLLTRVRVPWQAARRGGMFTALVGLLGAFLVGTYLGQFGGGGTLAALGGVAILLFFFNLMWAIYLFGAEVTKVYADFLEHGDVIAPSARRAAVLEQLAATDTVEEVRSAGSTGVTAFLIGLVTGWVARRRR